MKDKIEETKQELEEAKKAIDGLGDNWVLPVLLLLIFGLKGKDMIVDALRDKDKIIENNKVKEN